MIYLELKQLQYHKFIPKETNKLLRDDIPCFLGMKDYPSFLFMKGDLGNPNKETKSVELCKKIIMDKNKTEKDMILLHGVSGAGKTKTLYDLSREYYSIFFDIDDRSTKPDLNSYFNDLINANTLYYSKWDIFGERLTTTSTHFLICQRLLTLLLYISKNYINSPEEWLSLQLNSTIYSKMKLIGFYLVKNCLDTVPKINKEIIEIIEKISKKPFIFIIDEAHVLMSKLEKQFESKDQKYKDQKKIRSLMTPFYDTINKYKRVIISATYKYELINEIQDILASVTLKINEKDNQKLIKVDHFTEFIPKDALLHFGFIYKNLSNIKDYQKMANQLRGNSFLLI